MPKTNISFQILDHVPADWVEEYIVFHAAKRAMRATGMSARSFAQRWRWLLKTPYMQVRAQVRPGQQNLIEVRLSPETAANYANK